MNSVEHFMATDVEWDPTGRYVASSVSWWAHKVRLCSTAPDVVVFANFLHLGITARSHCNWCMSGGRETVKSSSAQEFCLPTWCCHSSSRHFHGVLFANWHIDGLSSNTQWLSCCCYWLDALLHTDWMTNMLIHWLANWLSGWLTDLLRVLADWLAHWMPGWLADWLAGKLTVWMIDWF